MNRSVLTLLIGMLFLAAGCSNEHPTSVDSQQSIRERDTVFPNIDTTLHIEKTTEGDLTIYSIDRYHTIVVRIPRISAYIFDPKPARSLKQIGIDSNYALVMNTSFIDQFITPGPSGPVLTYRHAGYLKINNVIIEHLKIERQLTALLAYDSRKNRAEYFDVNELDKTADYDLVVQTGPMIVRKNCLDSVAINVSFNGLRPAPRTMFASVNGRDLYVILTPAFVDLMQIGTMLISSGIFTKELNIIDFDGGPSTSLYIRNHPELCIFPDVKLPALMGVR